MFDGIVATAQSLPDKVMGILKAQVIDPLNQANGIATSVAKNIYPDTLGHLGKISGRFGGIVNQALSEIADVVKKSPFWDGKNNLKAAN